MTVSEFYRNPTIIESFGKSRVFEISRRMREVMPDFPTYSMNANEYHLAWLIFILSRSKTTTRKDVYNAIKSGKKLKSGNELFVHWLAGLLIDPKRIDRDIRSIWIFQDDPGFIQVNLREKIQIFQEEEKVRTVANATYLCGAFLFDFAMKLKDTWRDESLDQETVFEEDESINNNKNNE